MRTPPSAASKRTGMPVRIRWIASSPSTPITESCGPVMPDVGDRGRAAGLDARVGGLDVRVRAEHGGHAAVEPVRERDLLARRLGVDVDDDDRRPLPRLVDELVDELQHARRRLEEERAEHVDHRHRRPVGACTDREPAAGRRRREFAGRITRSDVCEVRPDLAARRHVWLPSVITSAPAASSRSASFGVIPTPSATFSPLRMQTSAPSSSRSRGSRSSTARRPGRADHVADEEDPQRRTADRQQRRPRGAPRARRCCPRPACSGRAPGARRAARSTTVPTFERAAATGEPTVSAGSGRAASARRRRRRGARPDVDPRAVAPVVERRSRVIPTTVPSTGE